MPLRLTLSSILGLQYHYQHRINSATAQKKAVSNF